MTVASCPSCQESVTVPVDATSDCIARCPLCHEEFKLEAFLNQLPPSLIVLNGSSGIDGSGINAHHETDVDADPDASSSNVLAQFSVADTAAETGGIEAGDVGKRSIAKDDTVPTFDFTPGSVSEDGEEPARAASRRTGRRQKNTTVEVIKIVAGALLAIPAAQIILWLAPGDWKRDLLGIGPAVSRVVPWIVPEKFRAPEDNANDENEWAPESSRANEVKGRQARPRANNGSAKRLPDSGTKSTTKEPNTTTEPAGEQPAAVSGAPPVTVEPSVPPAKVDTAVPPAKETASTPRNVLVNGVRGAPLFELADVRSAIEAAMQASVAWDTSEDQSVEQRAALTERFYEAFAQLSETVTFAPPQPGTKELVLPLHDVLKTFAKEPKKLAMIGNQTSTWLDQPTRPNQGIFIFGTVKQIKSSRELFETELELAALKKRTITVVSRVDPRKTFAKGDRVLMLGAIVAQPASNLLGYEGKEPMVVMGGFPVLLE